MRTAGHQCLMKRQQRRRAYADGELSDGSWTEEERPESAEQPVAQRQVRRPVASTPQDDQLLLEQEILRDHGSHATGATQLRGDDGQVKQDEQEVLHARASVGQTSDAAQRCLHLGFSEEWGIRDPQVLHAACNVNSTRMVSNGKTTRLFKVLSSSPASMGACTSL